MSFTRIISAQQQFFCHARMMNFHHMQMLEYASQ